MVWTKRAGRSLAAALTLISLSLAGACGSNGGTGDAGGDGEHPGDGSVADGGSGDGGGMDADLGDGATGDAPVSDGPVQVSDAGITVHDPDGTTWTCFQTTCASHLLQCGDCTDNDGDGLIDAHDPDCLGPCSNSEANLFGAVGGGTSAACTLNCYFNFGQGSGNGGCEWDHRCDPLEVAPNFSPVGDHCAYEAPGSRSPDVHCPDTQSTGCVSSCQPLTPNGCDCFGCCAFHGQTLYLGSRDSAGNPTCTIEAANAATPDTTRCQPCTQVNDNCANPCGPCEYCIDGHVPDPSCFTSQPDGGAPGDGGVINPGQCGAGLQRCGAPGQAACPFGFYCITGCCEQAPG